MSLKRRSLRHDLQARVDHQTPRAFDFEGSRWPPQFHYTGPFHDGAGRAEVDFPWDRLTVRNLFVTLAKSVRNRLLCKTLWRVFNVRSGVWCWWQRRASERHKRDRGSTGRIPRNHIEFRESFFLNGASGTARTCNPESSFFFYTRVGLAGSSGPIGRG